MAVNLAALDAQQLTQVKKQIDDELDHLTQSFAQLHAVKVKFRECLRIVKARAAEQPVLVPLTSSLYIHGYLANSERLIVDVGTGYYVEKDAINAERFYESRTQKLTANIQDLEKIIQRKSVNAQSLEDVLHQRANTVSI
ncbi:hypothetical protein ACRALDRAFT_1062786 [Sodiomyces alcalophilus JCM 7366]|uniref:uncharacterized protein n=1 Tax=Sodiomyces alcalophilus JCM 7366 TaxID=591952 RepID=UPI0039B6BC36